MIPINFILLTVFYLCLLYWIGEGSYLWLQFLTQEERDRFLPFVDHLLHKLAMGFAVNSVFFTIAGILGFQPSRAGWLLLLILFALAPAAMYWRKHGAIPVLGISDCFSSFKLKKLLFTVSFLVLLAAPGLLLMQNVHYPAYSQDAKWIWMHKSAVVLHESPADSDYFWAPVYRTGHQAYPLGLPYASASIQALFGGVSGETYFKLPQVVIWIILMLSIFIIGRSFAGEIIGGLLTVWFASMPHIVVQSGMGRPDLALAAFAGVLVLLMLKMFQSFKTTDAYCFFTVASCLFMLKNEGIPLSLLSCGYGVSMLLFIYGKGCFLPLLRGISGMFISVSPWLLFSIFIPKEDENYMSALLSSNLMQNISYIPKTLNTIYGYLGPYFQWRLLPIVVLCCLVFSFFGIAKNKFSQHLKYLLTYTCVMLISYGAVILAVFMIADEGYRGHSMVVVIHRIFFAFLPFCAVIIAGGLGILSGDCTKQYPLKQNDNSNTQV